MIILHPQNIKLNSPFFKYHPDGPNPAFNNTLSRNRYGTIYIVTKKIER